MTVSSRGGRSVAALPGADPELVSQVKSMVQESVSVPVDWDELSLGDAGRYVARTGPEACAPFSSETWF